MTSSSQMHSLHQPSRSSNSVCVKRIQGIINGNVNSGQRLQPLLDRLPSLLNEHAEIVYEFHAESAEGSYLLCERLEGDTLFDLLARERRLSIEMVCSITRQAATALTAAHALDIMHGNLSPQSIMVKKPDSDGGLQVKVRDFGLGQPLAQDLYGALGYLAPEQVDPKEPHPEPTRQSDQFALAVIAFEMLAGKRAFLGDTLAEISPRLLQDPVHFQIQGVTKKESARVIAVLHKAMARLPAERYANLSEFVVALETRAPNGKSRGSVMEPSRYATVPREPIQLGASVAQALVLAAKRLPGSFELPPPGGNDAPTMTMVRCVNGPAGQGATIPMGNRLELMVNVQTTIANHNQIDNRVAVYTPPQRDKHQPSASWRTRRVLLAGLCGALLAAGLALLFLRLPSLLKPPPPPVVAPEPQGPIVTPLGSNGGSNGATGDLPDPSSSTSKNKPVVIGGPGPDKPKKPKAPHRFRLNCTAANKLAAAVNDQQSDCSDSVKAAGHNENIILSFTVSDKGRPTLAGEPDTMGPAPLVRCLREVVKKLGKGEYGTLPRAGGLLRCTIK